MVTRRRLLAAGATGGAAALIPAGWTASGRALAAAAPLDARDIPKYVTPLRIPPAMPTMATDPERDTYEIAVRQFRQQILPPSAAAYHRVGLRLHRPPRQLRLPGAHHHGPGGPAGPGDLGQPARRRPGRLPAAPAAGGPHPALGQPGRWHRPPGSPWALGRQSAGYGGPVPQVVHLHGAHSSQESDGLLRGVVPAGGPRPAARLRHVRHRVPRVPGPVRRTVRLRWAPGSATFEYANDQRPCTLWYHDHTLGLTRENVYAGPAGFYLLSGGDELPEGVLPGPAPTRR